MSEGPFAGRVAQAMRAQGLTLRQLCRDVGLDASFFSKVLAGKRSPPVEEDVLRRIARRLELEPAELVVAAGRIPEEWQRLWRDPALFREVHGLATSTAKAFTTGDTEDAEAGRAGHFAGERSRDLSKKKMKPQRSSSASSVSSVVQSVSVVESRAPADLDTELL